MSNLKSNQFLTSPAYKLLRRSVAEEVAPLVLIVGSGVSRQGGFPDWRTLRQSVEKSLREHLVSQLDADPTFDEKPIEQVIGESDFWSFFRDAKALLGKATFNGLIESILNIDGAVSPALKALLELEPKGLITLNLDKTAGQAFNKHRSDLVLPINGFEISRKWNFITDEKNFLIYMHGHISDPSSWVLGRDQLDALTATGTHGRFLSLLYTNFTVLFVGVSADDVAISTPLVSIRNEGFEPRRLFWFTSRTDMATRQWANDNYVQLINYSANNDHEHLQKINTLVSDLKAFISTDLQKLPPQAIRTNAEQVAYVSPDALSLMTPEAVRFYISAYMSNVLSNIPVEEQYDKFYEISTHYDFPIKTRSFYRSKDISYRKFFGYDLTFPELGMGNFGTVYQALSSDGREVAIKIMHENIVNSSEMLGGFRRGVRCMRILTESRVDGIVPLIEAYEMPPTIVMQHISGNGLQEIFSEMGSISWIQKIRIISDAADVVDRCHKTAENVLHRDLKPSNIMISSLDYIRKSNGPRFRHVLAQGFP